MCRPIGYGLGGSRSLNVHGIIFGLLSVVILV